MPRRILPVVVALVAACGLGPAPAAAQPPASEPDHTNHDAWPTEQVHLDSGKTYCGLVESEDDVWVNLIEPHRPPGKPMYLVIRAIAGSSVAGIDRLEPEGREALRRRIDQFLNRAEIERGRKEAVPLQMVAGAVPPRFRYRGRWFELESTTDEDLARELIVWLEQVFTAYRQILPPRVKPVRPLRLMVFGSAGEYREFLAGRGLDLDNRAIYFRDENLIATGSELAGYAREIALVRVEHDKLLGELGGIESRLDERLRELGRAMREAGKPREEVVRVLRAKRNEADDEIDRLKGRIAACDRQNAQTMDKVAGRIVPRLFHEAFHAYLENYVYPHQRYHVPHWLNEGLGMVFERGLLESGSLRLDAPNREALRRIREDLARRNPLPLAKLLESDQGDFLAGHENLSETANRHYAYAWGLAHYLTFERHLLGSPALDRYVDPDAKPIPPVERFEALVGEPLATFEPKWRGYVRELR